MSSISKLSSIVVPLRIRRDAQTDAPTGRDKGTPEEDESPKEDRTGSMTSSQSRPACTSCGSLSTCTCSVCSQNACDFCKHIIDTGQSVTRFYCPASSSSSVHHRWL
jgi:hypothetical protein